jgi:hypothetical protein
VRGRSCRILFILNRFRIQSPVAKKAAKGSAGRFGMNEIDTEA